MTDLNHQLIADLDAAFPKVVEMMGARLYSGLRRMTGNPQEAEDLTQETLIRAYRALTDYEPDRVASLKLEPWVWTIALNLGRNHLRDRTRRPTPVVDVDRSLDDPEPVDTMVWDRRFSALTRNQRIAVVLRHVVGMGIEEISEVTGRASGTVKADIHRGLSHLRTIMEEES